MNTNTARKPQRGEPNDLARRSAKGQRTRTLLVEAGKRVFEERGLSGARVVDITERAGVSYGVFYHYFNSKEDLFCEVAEAQEDSLLSALHGASKLGLGTEEQIRWANHTYLDLYRSESKLMGVIETVSRQDAAVRRSRFRREDAFARKIQGSIEDLQAKGDADPNIDAWYAANALGYMVARFAEDWFVHGRDFDFETAVDQLTRLWLNAIGVRPENANLE